MNSQKVQSRVIARSAATKQSYEINVLETIRLLRSARNDSFLYFLRDHQIFLIIDEKKGDVKKEGRPITPPAEEIPQPRVGGIRFVPLYRGNSLWPVCFS
jgi:hypothetical protein